MSLFEDEPSSDDDCVQIDSTGKQELTIIKQEPTIMNPETIHMKQETISKTDMKDWFQFSPIKRSPAKSYSRRFKKSIDGCSESPGSPRKSINVEKSLSGFKKADPSKISSKLNFEHSSTIFENYIKAHKDLPEITSKSSEKSDKLIVESEFVWNESSSKSAIKHHDRGSFSDTKSALEVTEIKSTQLECTPPRKSLSKDDIVLNWHYSSCGIETDGLDLKQPNQSDKVLFLFNRNYSSKPRQPVSQKMPSLVQSTLEENTKEYICTKDTNKIDAESTTQLNKIDCSSGDIDNCNLLIDHTGNISQQTSDLETHGHLVGDSENNHSMTDIKEISCPTSAFEKIFQPTVDSLNIGQLMNTTEDVCQPLGDMKTSFRPVGNTESSSCSTGDSKNNSLLKDEFKTTSHLQSNPENQLSNTKGIGCLKSYSKNINPMTNETRHPTEDTGNRHPMSDTEDLSCPTDNNNTCSVALAESNIVSDAMSDTESIASPADDTVNNCSVVVAKSDGNEMSDTKNISCPGGNSEGLSCPADYPQDINSLVGDTEDLSSPTNDSDNICRVVVAESASNIVSDTKKTNHLFNETGNLNHPNGNTEDINCATGNSENISHLLDNSEDISYLLVDKATSPANPEDGTKNTTNPIGGLEDTTYLLEDNENNSHVTSDFKNPSHPMVDDKNTSNSSDVIENTNHPSAHSIDTRYQLMCTENSRYPEDEHESHISPTGDNENSNNSISVTEDDNHTTYCEHISLSNITSNPAREASAKHPTIAVSNSKNYITSEIQTETSSISPITEADYKNVYSEKVNMNIKYQVGIKTKDNAPSKTETKAEAIESFEELEDRSMSPELFNHTEHLYSDEDSVQGKESDIPQQEKTHSTNEVDTKPLLTDVNSSYNINIKTNCSVNTNAEICSLQFETEPARYDKSSAATHYSKKAETPNTKDKVDISSFTQLIKSKLRSRKESNTSEANIKIIDYDSNVKILDDVDYSVTDIEISVEHIKEINSLNENVGSKCLFVEAKEDLSPKQVEDVLVSLYSDDIEQMLNISNSSLTNLAQHNKYNPYYKIGLTLERTPNTSLGNNKITQEKFKVNDKSNALAADLFKGEPCTKETERSNKQDQSEVPVPILNVKKRGRPPKKKDVPKTKTQNYDTSELSQTICNNKISSNSKNTDKKITSAVSNSEVCEVAPPVSTEKISTVEILEHPMRLMEKREKPDENKFNINNELCNDKSGWGQNFRSEKISSGLGKSEINITLPDSEFYETVSTVSEEKEISLNNSMLTPLKQQRKRGRPSKKKTEPDSSLNTDDCESVQNTIINDSPRKSRITLSDRIDCKITSSGSNEPYVKISDETNSTPLTGQVKKRGRPPKEKRVINETDEMNSSIENNMVKSQSNTTLTLKEPIEKHLQLNTEQQTKRRGRPKKQKQESSCSTSCSKSINSPSLKYDIGSVSNLDGTEMEKNEEKLVSSLDTDDETPLISRVVECTLKKRGQKRKKSLLNDSEKLHSLKKFKSESDSTLKVSQDKKTVLHFKTKSKKGIFKKRKTVSENEVDNDPDIDSRSTKDVPSKQRNSSRFTYSLIDHEPLDKVVCGVCSEKMSYQDYEAHSMNTHYLLSWIEGETPMDFKDIKNVVSRLWIAKKHLGKEPFRCSRCKTTKLSAVGFQSHIQFCGANEEEREEMLWTCELCGSKMMPSSKPNHMYFLHRLDTSSSAEQDTSLIIPRTKRAAANRAEEVIQASQQDLEEEGGPESPLSCSEMVNDLKVMYCKPSKMLPKDIRDKWLTSLEESGQASCPNEGCDFTSDVFLFVRRHFSHDCSLTPIRFTMYRCKLCGFHRKDESEVQKHMLDKHQDKITALDDSCPESCDESDSDTNAQSLGAHRGFYNPNQTHPFKFLKQNQPVRYKKRKGGQFVYNESYKWTQEMREENLTPELVLYADMQPTVVALSPHEAAKYLPPLLSSMPFCGKDGVYTTLSRFQSTILDGVPMMFAGGPVWTAAWAPVPDTETKQFLALATLPDADLLHRVSSVYSYNSLIQIWAFNQLPNTQEAVEAPKLMLGLGHGHGAVWKLRWCPSGCYQGNRLGLLAAACSDGTVAIFSIPQHCPTESYIQVSKPVVELKLGCEMMAQCTSLDWHSVSPHNLIAGGFANGLVALWDLHTTTPLLKDGTTIFPYKVVEAHQSSVSAVSISPTYEDEAFMMTASLDRCTKFWHLGDLTAPVNVNRKAGVLDATMPSHWLTSISVYDDVYSLNNSYVTGYSYREAFWANNNNFMLQAGSVWSVSFNDWINSCALASEVGKLTLFFRQQILVHEEHKKVQKHSKYGDIIHCSMVHLNGEVSDKDYSSYSDCNSKLGLKFNLATQSIDLKKGDTGSSFDMYPVLSFNHVSWNQNAKSFLWLCAGMQSGLVLIPRLSFLSDTVSKWTSSEEM